ncbi:MAG: hypothetical protein KDA51_17095 [Planctomycetales bacterium]|nr:hypothetical protein [Planctomycetales bacterium]
MNDRTIGWDIAHCSWPVVAIAVGLVAFLLAAVVSWLTPFVPSVHDEFSYLLAADTLLHGRLANPPPEVWQPFQSFHILVEPAYASKYPLGLGAFVALGWALLGVPIAGCWLAAGLCAASMTWMLGGVTSRRWGILGGLLVACHPAMQVVWSQSLMSGWLTAAGASLLIGGVFRLRRRFHAGAALAAGTGIGLLALTRPFEGLVATLLASALLFGLWQGWTFKRRLALIVRAMPLASIPIAMALLAIGLQNYAITGRLDRMSYQVHEQQYGVAPLFVFGHQHRPEMEASGQLPATIRAYHYGWSLDSFQERAGLVGWLTGIAQGCWTAWGFWVLLAMVPVFTAGAWCRYRLTIGLALIIAVQIMFSATVCWVFPHYLSPILPSLVVLTVIGLRRIFRMFVKAEIVRMAQPLRFGSFLLAAQLVLLTVSAVRQRMDPLRAWAKHRAAISSELSSRDGKHLVLVEYASDHNVHQEWVYNLADLEDGKVLWARGEREDWNARLKEKYQPSRFIWRLEPDRPGATPELISRPNWD